MFPNFVGARYLSNAVILPFVCSLSIYFEKTGNAPHPISKIFEFISSSIKFILLQNDLTTSSEPLTVQYTSLFIS